MARPQVSWPAFNRYLYITQVSDLGPLGPLVFRNDFNLGHMVMPIYLVNFLWNHKANDLGSWHVALWMWALPSLINGNL